MPSTNNPLSISYEKVIRGETIKADLNTFNEIISQLEPSSLCPTNLPLEVDSLHHEPTGEIIPCNNDRLLPLRRIVHLKNLIQKGHLGNIFKYLHSVIEEKSNELNSDNIEKLLQILDHFLKIRLTELDLTSKKINKINEAYFALFASIAKLPETLHILSDDGRNPKIFELMSLLSGYIRMLNKLNANVSQSIKQSDSPYQIYAPLKSYLEGLGNLALNFRNEHPDVDLSKFEKNAVDLVNLMNNLTTDQLSTARYMFLSQYHDDTDLLSECERLFNTNNCDPYEFNEQYNLIYDGRSLRNNHLEPLVKKLLFGSTKDIQARLKHLANTVDKNNPFDNFLDYFKDVIKEKNQKKEAISPETIADLSKLIFYSTDVLTSTKPKSKIYDSVFSLLLHLLKNPAANDQLLHLWKAIEACADQMKYLLNHPQPGINSSIVILADIFYIANDIPTISMTEKQEMGIKIDELSIACLNIDKCSSSFALNQFSMTLGSMVRSLSKKNQTLEEKSAAQAIEKIAKRIVENAQRKIPEDEFKGLAWSYLKGRHDENINAIRKNCIEIFNLTNCQEFISANQTAVDTSNTYSDTNSVNSGLTLGASAAHGVGSGMINGIIQYFATKYSRQGEQSSRAKALVIYSSLLAHAALAATFPMMLFKIQEHINQGNEDEAQQLWDVLLLNALPTFIGSVVTNCGYHLACELSQSFSKRLHTLTQNIPLVATACNLYSNPMETGVHLATSFATSSLTYFSLNRWVSARKYQQPFDIETNCNYVKYDVQKNEVELSQPLNNEKIVSENEATKKTYQFICQPELEDVKKLSKNNLDQLINLIRTLEKNIENLKQQSETIKTNSVLNAFSKSIKDNDYILKILEVQFKSAETLYSLLSDNIHLSACEIYTLNRKKDFVSAMDKLGNVFKLMESNFKNLQGEIKAAIGYTEAASENFSDEVKTQLISLSQTIIFPLSKVTLYKDRYSNANAVEKTEKRCKAEVNQGLFNAIAKVDQPAISKRNKGFSYSRSDNDLRISTTSSSGESELSTVSESSMNNPITRQQTRPFHY